MNSYKKFPWVTLLPVFAIEYAPYKMVTSYTNHKPDYVKKFCAADCGEHFRLNDWDSRYKIGEILEGDPSNCKVLPNGIVFINNLSVLNTNETGIYYRNYSKHLFQNGINDVFYMRNKNNTYTSMYEFKIELENNSSSLCPQNSSERYRMSSPLALYDGNASVTNDTLVTPLSFASLELPESSKMISSTSIVLLCFLVVLVCVFALFFLYWCYVVRPREAKGKPPNSTATAIQGSSKQNGGKGGGKGSTAMVTARRQDSNDHRGRNGAKCTQKRERSN